MILFACAVLLLVVFFLPFLPGIREYIIKRDVTPLSVKSDYVKDPAFFAESFKEKIGVFLPQLAIGKGINYLKLSTMETVVTLDTTPIKENAVLPHICYADNKLETNERVIFVKEVYIRGAVWLGNYNSIRALACEGDARIGKGCRVARWIDATGALAAEADCDLGISASCGRELSLSQGCRFKRLYGFPVGVVAAGLEQSAGLSAAIETPVSVCELVDIGAVHNLTQVPAHSRTETSIITDKDLSVGESAIICGHIKTHGSLTLAENVFVAGNLFAEGEIRLGNGSRIMGTVFTHDVVTVGAGVIVGSPGKIKSVIGGKGVILEARSAIYGYVMTEGEGRVI